MRDNVQYIFPIHIQGFDTLLSALHQRDDHLLKLSRMAVDTCNPPGSLSVETRGLIKCCWAKLCACTITLEDLYPGECFVLCLKPVCLTDTLLCSSKRRLLTQLSDAQDNDTCKDPVRYPASDCIETYSPDLSNEMADWWQYQLPYPPQGSDYDLGQTVHNGQRRGQKQNTDAPAYNSFATPAQQWQAQLTNVTERASWSSQISNAMDSHSQEGMSPNEQFPNLPNDIPTSELQYGSDQMTADESPWQSPLEEGTSSGYASGQTTAKPSRRQSPIQEAISSGYASGERTARPSRRQSLSGDFANSGSGLCESLGNALFFPRAKTKRFQLLIVPQVDLV